MIVYALFDASGEGDGYTVYELCAITLTVAQAKATAALRLIPMNPDQIRPVHASMNAENGFVFVGKRDECSDFCYSHGGFVIEAIEVQ